MYIIINVHSSFLIYVYQVAPGISLLVSNVFCDLNVFSLYPCSIFNCFLAVQFVCVKYLKICKYAGMCYKGYFLYLVSSMYRFLKIFNNLFVLTRAININYCIKCLSFKITSIDESCVLPKLTIPNKISNLASAILLTSIRPETLTLKSLR